MAQTLPSGIKKFDPTDTVSRAAFNENWDTINGHLAAATSAATANTIAKRDAAGRMKAAAPVAADDVARKAEIDAPPFTTTTGTGAAYVATFSPAYSALVAGTRITVKFHVANTGAATINVNGLGAKSILRSGGAALTAGIIKLNAVMSLVYDGTNFILQGEGGNGNATAADLLIGKTASVDAGDIVGTMPNRSGHVTGQSISRSGTTLRIRPQPGYVPGDTANSVQWNDPNWIAANIPEDLSIFGLQGTLVRGSIVANGDSQTVHETGFAKISVRGLSFTPKLVVAQTNAFAATFSVFANTVAIISKSGLELDGSGVLSNKYIFGGVGQMASRSTTSQGTSYNMFQIFSDGFDMIVAEIGNTTIRTIPWIAFG